MSDSGGYSAEPMAVSVIRYRRSASQPPDQAQRHLLAVRREQVGEPAPRPRPGGARPSPACRAAPARSPRPPPSRISCAAGRVEQAGDRAWRRRLRAAVTRSPPPSAGSRCSGPPGSTGPRTSSAARPAASGAAAASRAARPRVRIGHAWAAGPVTMPVVVRAKAMNATAEQAQQQQRQHRAGAREPGPDDGQLGQEQAERRRAEHRQRAEQQRPAGHRHRGQQRRAPRPPRGSGTAAPRHRCPGTARPWRSRG